jgi:hypothetical protein
LLSKAIQIKDNVRTRDLGSIVGQGVPMGEANHGFVISHRNKDVAPQH